MVGQGEAASSSGKSDPPSSSPEPEAPPGETTSTLPPKNIVLFSDGTGNSSAKLFKTNVWRMYEAVDLGPDADGGPTQIAYYDNGVGTSSVKLLATIGGVFGWGLKRNVLEIYRYLCRNYRSGDRIYAFGFSRGAYTIRLVVGLIGSQGIVQFDDERHLLRQTADAYRAFQRDNHPNFILWGFIVGHVTRFVRDALIALWRLVWRHKWYRPSSIKPAVDFIGVWDTVAAYGGPIAEITRAIDNWIWPLSMTDQQLGRHVRVARHALALDDQRDAFHPVLWDEVYEARLQEAFSKGMEEAKSDEERTRYNNQLEMLRNRVRQVWFAGMHADVGGGYPDESLSFVSLLWMMREAGQADLRLLPDLVKRVQDLSTPLGPIHDSREGLAGYYRYQPRKIDAYIHPLSPIGSEELLWRTRSLRDPTTGERPFRPQGLLMRCEVHDSVIARINSATDGYAPISLPEHFEITPPPPVPELDGARIRPELIDQTTRDNLKDRAGERYQRQETLWNFVYKRRLAYFAIVVLSIVIAFTPRFVDTSQVTFDGRSVWGVVVGWIEALLPDIARPWLKVLAANPWPILVPALMIWIIKRWSAGREAKLRDGMRTAWREALAGKPVSGKKTSLLRRWRESWLYQLAIQTLKWRLAPNLIGPLLIAAMFWILLVLAAQGRLAQDERSAAICAAAGTHIVEPWPATTVTFATADPCFETGIRVRRGHIYRVQFEVKKEWFDGDQPATPLGVNSSEFRWTRWWKIYPATLLRRMVGARWMQPLYEIRAPATREDPRPPIFIDALKLEQPPGSRFYIGQFEARLDGELMLFVNEATWPRRPIEYFYSLLPQGKNHGAAEVTVLSLVPPEDAGVASRPNPAQPAQPAPAAATEGSISRD